MNAYTVRKRDEFCATVVFAETAGKAKSYALYTDACEGAVFTDIECRRMPGAGFLRSASGGIRCFGNGFL